MSQQGLAPQPRPLIQAALRSCSFPEHRDWGEASIGGKQTMPSPDSITCYQTQAPPQRGSMHARMRPQRELLSSIRLVTSVLRCSLESQPDLREEACVACFGYRVWMWLISGMGTCAGSKASIASVQMLMDAESLLAFPARWEAKDYRSDVLGVAACCSECFLSL